MMGSHEGTYIAQWGQSENGPTRRQRDQNGVVRLSAAVSTPAYLTHQVPTESILTERGRQPAPPCSSFADPWCTLEMSLALVLHDRSRNLCAVRCRRSAWVQALERGATFDVSPSPRTLF